MADRRRRPFAPLPRGVKGSTCTNFALYRDSAIPRFGSCGSDAKTLESTGFQGTGPSIMKKFLLSDLFFGILLTLFVAGSYLTGSAALESLELKFYDIRARLLQTPEQPPTEVAIVAIDDDSLTQLGRWPWPRGRVADMLEKLHS